MERDFYEATLGSPAVADSKFTVYSNLEVWVYPRGVATLANFRTSGPSLATIYQRSTGVAQGPSPEAGATGTNPFTTGSTGSVQFWAENDKYDIFVHDLDSPARLGDRLIPWEASPSGQRVPPGPETNLKIIRGNVLWDGFDPQIAEGSGFTVVKTTTGNFVVTFTTAFSDRPTVVATSTSNFLMAQAFADTGFPNSEVRILVRMPSTGDAIWGSFAFIAIGPA